MSKANQPNYQDLGLSTIMGSELRALVEKQLLTELKAYGFQPNNLKFDWSDSCIEGHDTSFLDGRLENFSGIAVFDDNHQLIAEGWMDFIHEGNFFLVYWDFLTVWENGKTVFIKDKPGIPDHVWQQIPNHLQWSYEKERMKSMNTQHGL